MHTSEPAAAYAVLLKLAELACESIITNDAYYRHIWRDRLHVSCIAFNYCYMVYTVPQSMYTMYRPRIRKF